MPCSEPERAVILKKIMKPQQSRHTGWFAGLVACVVSALHFSLILYLGYAIGMLVNNRAEYSIRHTRLLLVWVIAVQLFMTVFQMAAIKSWWCARPAGTTSAFPHLREALFEEMPEKRVAEIEPGYVDS